MGATPCKFDIASTRAGSPVLPHARLLARLLVGPTRPKGASQVKPDSGVTPSPVKPAHGWLDMSRKGVGEGGWLEGWLGCLRCPKP